MAMVKAMVGWAIGHHLLYGLVTSATCGVHYGLSILKFFDFRLVDCSFALFLVHIRRSFLLASVSPHFTQQPRNISVAHIWIIPLHHGSTRLRILEEGRHGALGSQWMFLGPALGNRPRSLVRSLLADKPVGDFADKLMC